MEIITLSGGSLLLLSLENCKVIKSQSSEAIKFSSHFLNTEEFQVTKTSIDSFALLCF